MADPVADALKRAQIMLDAHPDWDLMRALAEATTTEQCGVAGYTVFRDARQAISDIINEPLPHFCETAPRKLVREVLHAARVVKK